MNDRTKSTLRRNGQGKATTKSTSRKKNNHSNGAARPAAKPRAASRASRGAAMRASRMNADTASKLIDAQTTDVARVKVTALANKIDDAPRLRIIGIGGMNAGGAKNMMIVEYQNEAIVIDCGNELGVDLPGVNFAINDTTYLKKIRHKLKAYVITHGHLDHIGGLPYILPELPAPVYGSRFTIGMIEQTISGSDHQVEGFTPEYVIMNQDNHEKLKIGQHFTVELVRVTHSIPGSTAVVVDTPEGKIINTGDFRLDPEPLDHKPTDIERFKELAKEGVLVLMSDSTTGEKPGRTDTESTLEDSFHQIFQNAPGRVFVGLFSSNINRFQMIVNAAVADGRKIAVDGRSMMNTLETAVKLGFIKIPKGTFVPMANSNSMKDEELVIMCTGSQGEPNAALVRMSSGDHKHVKLKAQDTVVFSSNPIPESGNDAHIGRMVDNMVRKGVHVFRHTTRELDGCGPLHTSGHAGLEEYGDLIEIVKPTFFVPIYGSVRAKQYHIEEAVRRGVPRSNCYNNDNGEVLEFRAGKMKPAGVVEHGTVLVDNTGAIVSNVVVKDRLLMSQDGIVAVILTVDKNSGALLSSPDIITRGFIYMRDNEDLMNDFRSELRRVVAQRFKRVDLDRFKTELKDHVQFYLYERTQRSPIIIPVINVVSSKVEGAKRIARNRAAARDNRGETS